MTAFNFGDAWLPLSFWSKATPCPMTGWWLWVGAQTSAGYGMTTVATMKIGYAHRFAYERLVGPIAPGLQVDHLCRVRCCVNPAHAEPVTQRENTLRGVGFAAKNARVTACPKGHAYTLENTAHVVTKKGPARDCRQCARDAAKRFHRARRAA